MNQAQIRKTLGKEGFEVWNRLTKINNMSDEDATFLILEDTAANEMYERMNAGGFTAKEFADYLYENRFRIASWLRK